MKRNGKLFLVVGVLLVIIIGVTFAYYVVGTNVTGNGQNVGGSTSNGLEVIYDAGSSKLETDEFYPSKVVRKEFTVTVNPINNIKNVLYAIKLNINENTFEKCTDSNYDVVTNACVKDALEVVYRLKDNNGNIIADGDLTNGVTGNIILKKESKTVETATEFRYTLELEFKDTQADQNHNINKVINSDIIVEFAEPDAKDTILADVEVKEGATEFTGIADTDEGIFTGTDDDGTTYYWRGAVANNYLKFADKWWRIIRINGDGTIRIIYDGTAYHANGTSTTDSQIGRSKFNSSCNDNAYVGFMYGQAGASTYEATHTNTNKSTIMTTLEAWYANNLEAYESKIDMNAGFCGDRSLSSTSYGNGVGKSRTFYGAYGRTILNGSYLSIQTPIFKCSNSNDLYTVSGSLKGNKAMMYPIGLITMDEVLYAGGFGGRSNSTYYLYSGNTYWTMSPYESDSYGNAGVFYVNDRGWIYGTYVNGNIHGIRPVINLRADVQITGTGTGEDPFVVN